MVQLRSIRQFLSHLQRVPLEKSRPVNLVFLQVAKRNCIFALPGPNLSALREACNRGPDTKEVSLVAFHIVKIFAAT